ncbi:uncharacterized protein [Coffea arabica]|uniref:Transposase n=1 Tax=Coffea arabica TaxID=13443 RepID=A0A6P6W470_COFAR|nr:uncharacterized protein LOC113728758 [Coffea arabica]
MFNVVHIDEKWFYMTKECEKYYLYHQGEQPLRTCKSKKFIVKVMFLAAIARTRFDCSGNPTFDEKSGIFPFVFKELAKMSSKNHMPRDGGSVTEILIQQDNGKPHIDPTDPKFIETASRDGFDIHLSFQPPNSPDMNILDLGYFRAIQCLQHQEAPVSIDELILAVKKSFDQLSSESLNNVFLTLQSCMVEVMKNLGGHNYKVLHIGKHHLMKEGCLPL